MRTDRFFYDPGPLAIGKGIAYALAFFTAIQFENAHEQAYYFGIIIFCCGIICDYIEIAAYKDEKCSKLREMSLVIAVVVGLIVIFLVAILYKFDEAKKIVKFVERYQFFINLVFTVFWILPLGSGLVLAVKSIRERTNRQEQTSQRYPIGYRVKP